MAPSDSLVQRILWKNRKNGIFEALFQQVNDIVQMRDMDMAHSICLIKLYQITMRKNFDFLFLTTLILIQLDQQKRRILRIFAVSGGSARLLTGLVGLGLVYNQKLYGGGGRNGNTLKTLLRTISAFTLPTFNPIQARGVFSDPPKILSLIF